MLKENKYSVFADTPDGVTHRYCLPCDQQQAERIAEELRRSGRVKVRIISDAHALAAWAFLTTLGAEKLP